LLEGLTKTLALSNGPIGVEPRFHCMNMKILAKDSVKKEGVEVNHAFLTSALDGGGWSASHPGLFTPGTHWIGGWVYL